MGLLLLLGIIFNAFQTGNGYVPGSISTRQCRLRRTSSVIQEQSTPDSSSSSSRKTGGSISSSYDRMLQDAQRLRDEAAELERLNPPVNATETAGTITNPIEEDEAGENEGSVLEDREGSALDKEIILKKLTGGNVVVLGGGRDEDQISSYESELDSPFKTLLGNEVSGQEEDSDLAGLGTGEFKNLLRPGGLLESEEELSLTLAEACAEISPGWLRWSTRQFADAFVNTAADSLALEGGINTELATDRATLEVAVAVEIRRLLRFVCVTDDLVKHSMITPRR